jgi:DNA-binding transcriptional LysR family regulator
MAVSLTNMHLRRAGQSFRGIILLAFIVSGPCSSLLAQEPWLRSYQTCQDEMQNLQLSHFLTDVFWGPLETQYVNSWGNRPVVVMIPSSTDLAWLVANGHAFAVRVSRQFKVQPSGYPPLYVVYHKDRGSAGSLFELWDRPPAGAESGIAAAYPDALENSEPVSQLRVPFRELLKSEIASAKVRRSESFDPSAVAVETFKQALVNCLNALGAKDDLSEYVRSKLQALGALRSKRNLDILPQAGK